MNYPKVGSRQGRVGPSLAVAIIVAVFTALAAVPVRAASDQPTSGYWLVGRDGGVFAFGDAGFYGSGAGLFDNDSVVGMAGTPGGDGYWIASYNGVVASFGTAGFFGHNPVSTGGPNTEHVPITEPMSLDAPIVGIAATSDGSGYWLVGRDGGVFAFGDAPFYGSLPEMGVHADDIVGIVSTPGGYWLVGSDGGVFAFGSAPYYGSIPGDHIHPVAPISAGTGVFFGGHSCVPTGPCGPNDVSAYWLAGNDGGAFAFGAGGYYGGTAEIHLASPIVGIAATSDGRGYWEAGIDGGVFGFGDAAFEGSLPSLSIHVHDIVGIAT